MKKDKKKKKKKQSWVFLELDISGACLVSARL